MSSPATDPLAGWRDFPVDRTPRPILLLGSPLRVPGFRDGYGKEAVSSGRLALATELPDGAAEAWLAVLRSTAPGAGPVGTGGPAPLWITNVSFGSAEFFTDRDRTTLPAWLFDAPELLGPMAWPALEPGAFWRLGELTSDMSIDHGRLAPDGVTLTVSLPAPHPRPHRGDSIIEIVPNVDEHRAFVVIGYRERIVGTIPGTPPPDAIQDLVAYSADHTVTLAAPLGNRVLVTESGTPVPVRPLRGAV